MNIQELAERARGYFVQKRLAPQKPGEEGKPFWTLKDSKPKWIYDMVFRVHDSGAWLPDDYKYEYIVDALDAISEGMDPESPELQTDVYNHDLLAWLSSHLERAGIVDEVVLDIGHSDQGIMGDIIWGQGHEREEVFYRVVEALNERLDAIARGEPERFVKSGGEDSPKDWSPR